MLHRFWFGYLSNSQSAPALSGASPPDRRSLYATQVSDRVLICQCNRKICDQGPGKRLGRRKVNKGWEKKKDFVRFLKASAIRRSGRHGCGSESFGPFPDSPSEKTLGPTPHDRPWPFCHPPTRWIILLFFFGALNAKHNKPWSVANHVESGAAEVPPGGA